MKKAKSIIGVIVIFLLGTFSGALGIHIVYKIYLTKYISGEPNIYQKMIVRNLSNKLNLDANQRSQIQIIVQEIQIEMQTVRKQFRPQIESILEKSRLRTREILRPDQIDKFDKLIAQRKIKSHKNY
ncbi:MAG: hypothetical protein HY787_05820 [Deltaproteobacteria bacterium]|nr:hypothetical protein [Deltaproteobacteria bacterium]